MDYLDLIFLDEMCECDYDEEMYYDLCERADYYGMESLTEDEQLFLKNYK